MNDKSEASSVSIHCGDTMDISAVAGFRTQLLDALSSGQAIELDASELERADTAALQLLTSFIQAANSQQSVVTWKSPSQAFCDSAALLGLSGFLNLESVAA